MPKRDLTLRHGCSPVNLLNIFLYKTSPVAASGPLWYYVPFQLINRTLRSWSTSTHVTYFL